MKKEEFELCLSEAKDQLSHINASIKETRTQIYFLIVLMFGLVGYFSTDLFEFKIYTLKSIVLYFCLLNVCLLIYFCRYAIVPIWLRFDGMSPKGFKSILREDELSTRENILHTYQLSIEINGKHLNKLSDGYNKAFKALIICFVCISLFCLFAIFTKSLK